MTRLRLCAQLACSLPVAVLAAALMAAPNAALAQQGSGFLDNLFNRGQQRPVQQAPAQQPEVAQAGASNPDDVNVRIDRIEQALRQLTGTVEQLQHQNQLLQTQIQRMQSSGQYPFQQMGRRDNGNPAPMMSPPNNTAPTNTAPPAAPGQHSDAFNPALHPNAPGVPHQLGNPQTIAAPEPQAPGQNAANEQPVGAPGGRAPGAPLNLSTLAGDQSAAQPPAPVANAAPMGAPPGANLPPPQGRPMSQQQSGRLPPPPPRNPNATGEQLATLPPSSSPKDEYELAYGYVLHKDYGLAVQAFRDFLRRHPHEKLIPDAQYWLGESQFQQQHYRDAAEAFLAVSTKYEHSGKAPQALLRLGQSLAALHQKEAACATLAEVGRKYPHASASVKRGVVHEQKRVHC